MFKYSTKCAVGRLVRFYKTGCAESKEEAELKLRLLGGNLLGERLWRSVHVRGNQALQAALALEHRAAGVVDRLPRIAHVAADHLTVAREQLAPFARRRVDEVLPSESHFMR